MPGSRGFPPGICLPACPLPTHRRGAPAEREPRRQPGGGHSTHQGGQQVNAAATFYSPLTPFCCTPAPPPVPPPPSQRAAPLRQLHLAALPVLHRTLAPAKCPTSTSQSLLAACRRSLHSNTPAFRQTCPPLCTSPLLCFALPSPPLVHLWRWIDCQRCVASPSAACASWRCRPPFRTCRRGGDAAGSVGRQHALSLTSRLLAHEGHSLLRPMCTHFFPQPIHLKGRKISGVTKPSAFTVSPSPTSFRRIWQSGWLCRRKASSALVRGARTAGRLSSSP